MRRPTAAFPLIILAAAALAACASMSGPDRDAAIAGAVADSTRPAADTARDPERKPVETLAFAGVKPGDKVMDFMAGGGYFTRLFGDVVGPGGHVYAVEPKEVFTFPSAVKNTADLQAWAAVHSNVSVSIDPAMNALQVPEPLDLFWISQNYHDLKDKFMGPLDTAVFNRAVYAALKPGGTYVILDHAAVKGAPSEVTETLHRIDPEVVRREVEAAGFKFEGESTILANPDDPHTVKVFDKSIRGHTDQFIYKFRKPQ
ncbi:MAG TPA: hypothetical protein VFA75_03775 [Nevskia sp.]|jgi:predicted methyltransferase|nr:hypothetical protein [Nevskia sp.]